MKSSKDLIINFNKPSGITSQQAVSGVKRLLGVKKAGHTGTLDPMATGVLLVCLNEATKVSRFLLNLDKRYRATIKLGERTDTYDAEGRITEKKDPFFLNEGDVVSVVRGFVGSIIQEPPMYSAVKVEGKKLYELARRGIVIKRPERCINIYDLKVSGFDLPFFDLAVSCSKGTYIRTLCDDIGKALGTGAHLFSLERSAIGPFDLKNAASAEELGKEDFFQARKESYCTIDKALPGLNEIVLDEVSYRSAKNGLPIKFNNINELRDDDFVKLKSPQGDLFGIGRINCGLILIERILNI
jgi:tRNA pseudouridine55 synthase